MIRRHWLGALAFAAAFAAQPSAALAESETVTLTGIQDFDMAVISRPLFAGLSGRNPVLTQARWQINGDEVGPLGTLGIFAVFDLDASLLFAGGEAADGAQVAGVDSLVFRLPPAVNLNTGTGGIAEAGDLSIYFTTSDVDVLDPANGIIFDNGGGTDSTGLGEQFENLSLLSSEFQETGIYEIERSIIPADIAGFEQALLDRLNNGGNIRFLIASQTPGFSSNFGTGNEDTSPIFNFFGDPPTVSFNLNIQQAAPLPPPTPVPLLGPFGRVLLGLVLFAVTFHQLRSRRQVS